MAIRLRCKRVCLKLLNWMTLLSVITMCYFILKDPKLTKLEKNINSVDTDAGAEFYFYKEQNYLKLPKESMRHKKNVDDSVFLIIGLSTVCRHKSDYLKETIDSLINNTNPAEKIELKIVVSVSDLNTSCSHYVTSRVQQLYSDYLLTGLIEVIIVPKSYYPSFDNLKRTFNDSLERVKWRSQQNLDYSYLINYVYLYRKSLFYLHLEDDVISAPEFFRKIKSYINEVKENWAVLEFSSLGFIGKLFHWEDLAKLASLLRSYFAQMPCDYLLIEFMKLMLQDKRFIKIPTLFQHHGIHSSLPHLTRNVSDNFFFIARKDLKGDNPPASVSTSLQLFSDLKAEFAYLNSEEKYLWASSSKIGDTVTVKFKIPQKLERIVVESGFPLTKRDKIQSAILEISNVLEYQSNRENVCVRYYFVGKFIDGRVDIHGLSKSLTQPVSCVRVKITKKQNEWILIREIAVFVVRL